MSSGRRKLLVGVGATAGAASVALGLWFGVLPGVAGQRAADAIRRRTGGNVTVGGASVGLSGVTLRDLTVSAPDGGLDASVASVGVRTGAFGWLGGASSVRSVDLHGLRVRWDTSRPGAAALLRRLRPAPTSQATGDGRPVTVDGADVLLEDAGGPLLHVVGATLTRGTGRVVLSADAVELGAEPGDRVTLHGVAAVLARVDGRMAIRELRASGAELSWAPPRDSGAAPRSPFARILAAAELLRGSRAGAGAADEDASGSPRRARSWIAPDMKAHVDEVSVHLRRASGDEEIVRRLTAEGDAQPDGSLHVRGQAENAEGGTARWDLFVWPSDLRAEGSVAFRSLPLALLLPFLPGVPFHEPEHARLDGDLVLRGEGLAQVAFTGSLRVADLALSSPRIAPVPVRAIGLSLSGAGVFVPALRRLTVTDGRVTVGRATVRGSGTVEWTPDHYLFDVTSTLPPTPCGDAVSAIPPDLLAELSGFSFSGTLGGHFNAHVDSRDLEATRLDLGVADGCQFVTVPELADLRRFDGPFDHVVEEPDGSVFEMETGPGSDEWTPVARISPFMTQAVLAHEDAGFFHHRGFAVGEIRTALVRDLAARRYVQGASTITMQLVKNLFLRREKTLARKVQEVLLTWWIERALDKGRILELYLNVIEYGPHIYGIRHAADHYFGKTPAELTPAECAYLAMILPNPKSFHDQYEAGAVPQRFLDRVAAFLRREVSKSRIDQAALDDGLAELAHFQFHREGDPPPPPRAVAGHATPLPIALDAPVEWADESQGGGDAQWDAPPDDAP